MQLSQLIYHSPFTMLLTFMLTSGLIFLLASAGNIPVLNGSVSLRYHYNKLNMPSVHVGSFPRPLKILFWLLVFMLYNLGLHYLVNWLEQFFPVSWQLTRLIAGMEGNLSVLVQSLATPFLTSVLSFFYIFVFPALILGVYLYLMLTERAGLALLLLCAVGANYLLAVPFYLLTPVYETWYYNPQVKLLIEEVYPAFNHTYRFFSGLNNNFPSLHTSIFHHGHTAGGAHPGKAPAGPGDTGQSNHCLFHCLSGYPLVNRCAGGTAFRKYLPWSYHQMFTKIQYTAIILVRPSVLLATYPRRQGSGCEQ